MTQSALVVGGSRGLGKAIVQELRTKGYETYASVRSDPKEKIPGVHYLTGVDLAKENASVDVFVSQLKGIKIDLLFYTAAIFYTDDLAHLNWKQSVDTYIAVSVAPPFIIGGLYTSGILADGAKVGLVTTEGGSISLRTKEEGGGNYAHHGSKAAANMAGHLLSLDLQDRGIAVAVLHPGFMRTEMTASVGFDKYWDSGGAVLPEESAAALVPFLEKFTLDKTGTFWAPLGPKDVGQAENVLGKDLPTPLQLPW